jgi:hypothetical protein
MTYLWTSNILRYKAFHLSQERCNGVANAVPSLNGCYNYRYMRNFIAKHSQKILAGHSMFVFAILAIGLVTFTLQGSRIISLLAAATSSLATSPAVLYFTPYDDNSLPIGATAKIDININARIPINAVGVTVKFPQDMLEIVSVSKEKSFLDLWTEDTAIKEDTGEVHFSGGTLMHGGITGSSTALTLSIRAKKAGEAVLSFEEAQVYASDGKGASVDSDTHSFTIEIPSPSTTPAVASSRSGGGATSGTPAAPLPRSFDLNGDGKVTIVDISILIVHIFATYDARYDFDMDGSVGISDLSILLSKVTSGT